jgi:hypothetical protein
MYLSHLEIPHEQWPGEKVYFFCPDCDEVCGIPKGDGNRCPKCRRLALKDIFVEISERIAKSWSFFEKTRSNENKWLFHYKPGSEVSFFATNLAMALYGELRSLGFSCPWEGSDDEIIDEWVDARLEYLDPATGLIDCSGLGVYLWYSQGPNTTISQYVSSGLAWNMENRLFAPEKYRVQPGKNATKDALESIKNFHDLVKLLPDSYGGGSWITGALANHREILRERGEGDSDKMIDYVHRWLDQGQDPETGRWLGCADKEYNPDTIANGMFKVMVSYESFNWEIHYPEQIIDFLIDVRADPKRGFEGEATCSIFDPMMVAWVLRKRGCDHRKEEINEVIAKSFLAFKDRWDDEQDWFKLGTWQEKHNFGTPLYMATVLLELPIMDICGIYNWRLNPVITRDDDGRVTVNEVSYEVAE